MDLGRVSASYARAFLLWANQQKLASEAYAQSKLFAKFLRETPEFVQLLSSPAVVKSKKQKIASSILLEFAPHLTGILSLIIKNGREKQLGSVLLLFQKFYRKDNGMVSANVESANELSQSAVDGIKSFLEKKLGLKVEIEHTVKPDLIGGFTLTIDDRLMDKSVKGELELLRKSLLRSKLV
jgi:F-type H+-transporting ATPase subunit delta